MQLILGFVFLLVFFYLVKNALQSSKANYRKWLIKVSLTVASGILLLLVVTGRLHVLAALGAALVLIVRQLPLIIKALPFLQQFLGKAKQKGAQGQQSTLNTSLLNMTLDHDSGEMDGLVSDGAYQGQRLSQMGTPELGALYQLAVAHYPDSLEVLETYFERVYGERWRDQLGLNEPPPKSSGGAELSVDEALDILGLESGASEEEVIVAHRKMMQKFHPDRGGSNYLAAQVNAAKEVLLQAIKRNTA